MPQLWNCDFAWSLIGHSGQCSALVVPSVCSVSCLLLHQALQLSWFDTYLIIFITLSLRSTSSFMCSLFNFCTSVVYLLSAERSAIHYSMLLSCENWKYRTSIIYVFFTYPCMCKHTHKQHQTHGAIFFKS